MDISSKQTPQSQTNIGIFEYLSSWGKRLIRFCQNYIRKTFYHLCCALIDNEKLLSPANGTLSSPEIEKQEEIVVFGMGGQTVD